MTEARLYEPIFSREIETLISFDSLHVELRGARGHARLRLYLSRYAPLQTLQVAFVPDQADLLIGHLGEAVTAIRAGSAGECRASVLGRIATSFSPRIVLERTSPGDDPRGAVIVRAEAFAYASRNRIKPQFNGYSGALATTWLALEKAEKLIAVLAEALPQMDDGARSAR